LTCFTLWMYGLPLIATYVIAWLFIVAVWYRLAQRNNDCKKNDGKMM